MKQKSDCVNLNPDLLKGMHLLIFAVYTVHVNNN